VKRAPLAAAVLLSVLGSWILASRLIRDAGPTYDEPVHLAAGWTDLADGRYRLNAMDHPPLGEMWAALPLAVLRPERFPGSDDWLYGRVYHYGDLFLYHNRVTAGRLLAASRTWALLTLTLLVAAALVSWAARLAGPPAAWGAAAALAACVPWASNAALVTTDAPSAALFFAAFALLARRPRTRASWAWAGAAAGAALASKFNMILLPPLAGFALAAEARAEPRARPKPADLALAAATALLVLAAAYRFAFAPLWWKGLTATLSRLSAGRPAYLLGAHSTDGWWWYFPAAMLVKTPPALLLLGGLGAWEALRRPRAEAAWLTIPFGGYLAAAMFSKTDIGYRHVLPLYPILCLWAGLGAARLWRGGRAARAALAAAALGLGVSAAAARPHPLAYFNALAAGHGERWLSDSNYDWGQDLPALARALAARGNPPVVLAYFGSGDPAAYGLRYVPAGLVSNDDRPGNAALVPGGPVLLAVSETNQVGTYYRDPDLFAWLKARTPVDVLGGGTIRLYDLTADRDGRARLARMLAESGRPGDARAAMVH
jgi:hypothetical protein